MTTSTDTVRTAVWASVFGGAGVLHFAVRPFYDTLVPEQLPGEAKYWTWGSGVLEFALAAAIANPGTRKKAARPAAAFLLGVLPGNVKMALDWQKDDRKSPALKAGGWARVALQFPMIASVLRVGQADHH
ncbi:DoxX family protein [Corynebacterium terpenotabidum]|uniref:DoxX family protein n=1 Tax=Corynebacterium terpenotabidum Y-11 TaxID=1200352 RepID=S4XJ53_9CORY|nr:hypothetical protein [Corynebacterium terpenotabidum]AGP31785.1 hypothetical protein A606_10730 [Corynebacterium terpenotabidum Y-11]